METNEGIVVMDEIALSSGLSFCSLSSVHLFAFDIR
jgi:hypothetical protein